MQGNRTVRVKNTLGTAGSPRGVAQCGGVLFREIGIPRYPIRCRKKILIRFPSLRKPAAAIIHDEHAFEVDQRLNLLEQIQQHGLYDQKPVLRMIHDVGEFVRTQPQVTSVYDGAGDRDTEISFQMRMPVPHQCCHPVSLRHTRIFESSGQLPGAPVEISIGVAVASTGWQNGDDFGIGKERARPLQDAIDQQRR